jgi:plasmid segregation protein ParM
MSALGKGIDTTIENTIKIVDGNVKPESYVITLDIGKYETKAIGRNIEGTAEDIERVNFRTKIYDMKKGYLDVEGNSSKIEFNGQQYIIGEQGESKSNETSKTNLLHQLSAYVAISRIIKPNTPCKINTVLACPLSVLKIESAKDEYKQFIKGTGEINVVVNNEPFSFEIENIMVKAEGSGVLYTKPELFKGKNVAVIDFGGLNMGFAAYYNGVCKQSDRFGEEFGTTELVLRIKDALTTMENGNVVRYDIAEAALEAGHMKTFSKIKVESIEPINNAKNDFFNDALEIIKTHKYILSQFDELVFVGGTTQKIKDQILKAYPNAHIPENSQWTTAEGLYKVAYGKYCK